MLAIAMGKKNYQGGHGNFQKIKKEIASFEDCSPPPKRRKCSEQYEVIEISEGSEPTNQVTMSSSVETPDALFIVVMKHQLVDLSICSVSEAKVELKWIPKVPLLHWLKENAKNEKEKDALVKFLNLDDPVTLPQTLTFCISEGRLDQNQAVWTIDKKAPRTVLRIPKVETIKLDL